MGNGKGKSAVADKDFFASMAFDSRFNKLTPGKDVFVAYDTQFINRRGITLDDLQLMFDNYKNRVIDLEVNFDYDHHTDDSKGGDSRAAGWVTALKWGEVEVDGVMRKALFAVPKWTVSGAKAVDEGEYLYTSPEIWWKWPHPRKGEVYKSVLRRIALTNDPQIDSQPPASVFNANGEEKIETKGDVKMDKLKALAIEQGAKFSANPTEDEVTAFFASQHRDDVTKIDTLTAAKAKVDTELKTVIAEKTTIAGERDSYKKQIDDKATADKKAVVDGVIKGAVDSYKLSPVEAEGYRKQIEADPEGMKALFSKLPEKEEFKKPEGSPDGDVEGKKDNFSAFNKKCDEMASKYVKDGKFKTKAAAMRAVMQEMADEEKTAKKAGDK